MSDALLAVLDRRTNANIFCSIFESCFWQAAQTRLVAGGEEPLYLPAGSRYDYHQIIFRSNYPASALHEVAHWCIAGEQRRRQVDYGYWYEPDGRGEVKQRIFESVEVKPQALEWLFSVAAGRQFRVSLDNLANDGIDPFPFQLAVWQTVNYYLANGLPPRAACFWRALQKHFSSTYATDSSYYTLDYINYI
ncbi:MAG: elongation factor P hydroxylase [Zhongshania sp.]|jgi:elongation factor P hydroxylase